MLVGHMLIVLCTPIRARVLGLNKIEGALLLSVFGIVACVLYLTFKQKIIVLTNIFM